MTQTSAGFNGTIDAVAAATKFPTMMGMTPATDAVGSLKVTQVGSTNTVSVAAGGVGQNAVATALSAAEVVTVPDVTNGQWFLLVLNRIWSTGATALMWRNGGTTTATEARPIPSSYPASFAVNHGVNSDIPIAWVWRGTSTTTLSIVQIAYPGASVMPRSGSAAARDAYYSGIGLTLASKLGAQGREWFNTDTQQVERYWAEFDATVNPRGVATAGWLSTLFRPSYDFPRIGQAVDSFGALSFVNVNNGTVPKAQIGNWRFGVSLNLNSDAQHAANFRFLIDAVSDLAGDPPITLDTSVRITTAVYLFTNTTVRDLTLISSVQLSAGSGNVYKAGTRIWADYLGPAS